MWLQEDDTLCLSQIHPFWTMKKGKRQISLTISFNRSGRSNRVVFHVAAVVCLENVSWYQSLGGSAHQSHHAIISTKCTRCAFCSTVLDDLNSLSGPNSKEVVSLICSSSCCCCCTSTRCCGRCRICCCCCCCSRL